MKQISLINNLNQKHPKAYGGDLLKTRKGRQTGRPLDTKNSIHLVLRSTKAKGQWSFKEKGNENVIRHVLHKFSTKYGIKILSIANVGNHLHLQIRLANLKTYPPFIRAITAAIAMGVTGVNRWTRTAQTKLGKLRFWDRRPFTRIVIGKTALLRLKDYLVLNRVEGFGYTKNQARFIVAWDKGPGQSGPLRCGTG